MQLVEYIEPVLIGLAISCLVFFVYKNLACDVVAVLRNRENEQLPGLQQAILLLSALYFFFCGAVIVIFGDLGSLFLALLGVAFFMLMSIPALMTARASRLARQSQFAGGVILFAILAVSAFGAYAYIDTFVVNLDAQGGIVLFIVPVMQIFAIVGFTALAKYSIGWRNK